MDKIDIFQLIRRNKEFRDPSDIFKYYLSGDKIFVIHEGIDDDNLYCFDRVGNLVWHFENKYLSPVQYFDPDRMSVHLQTGLTILIDEDGHELEVIQTR